MGTKTKYAEMPKRARNAIEARIEAIVKNYGFDNFRVVANKRITTNATRLKLQKEISEREKELVSLKKKI